MMRRAVQLLYKEQCATTLATRAAAGERANAAVAALQGPHAEQWRSRATLSFDHADEDHHDESGHDQQASSSKQNNASSNLLSKAAGLAYQAASSLTFATDATVASVLERGKKAATDAATAMGRTPPAAAGARAASLSTSADHAAGSRKSGCHSLDDGLRYHEEDEHLSYASHTDAHTPHHVSYASPVEPLSHVGHGFNASGAGVGALGGNSVAQAAGFTASMSTPTRGSNSHNNSNSHAQTMTAAANQHAHMVDSQAGHGERVGHPMQAWSPRHYAECKQKVSPRDAQAAPDQQGSISRISKQVGAEPEMQGSG